MSSTIPSLYRGCSQVSLVQLGSQLCYRRYVIIDESNPTHIKLGSPREDQARWDLLWWTLKHPSHPITNGQNHSRNGEIQASWDPTWGYTTTTQTIRRGHSQARCHDWSDWDSIKAGLKRYNLNYNSWFIRSITRYGEDANLEYDRIDQAWTNQLYHTTYSIIHG